MLGGEIGMICKFFGLIDLIASGLILFSFQSLYVAPICLILLYKGGVSFL